MRLIRAFLVVLLVSVAGTVALPWVSSAAPTAPYTAMVFDNHGGFGTRPGAALTPDNSTFTVSLAGNPDSLDMQASTPDGNRYRVNIYNPSPAYPRWLDGVTYPLGSEPQDPNLLSPWVLIDASGGACNANGTLRIRQLIRDPGSGNLTGFAGSLRTYCGPANPTTFQVIELRWNSTVDYRTAGTDVPYLDFGVQEINMTGAARTVTVHANGSLPVTLGTAELAGTDPASFLLATDGCSGRTLAAGETCAMLIRPRARATAAQSAVLRVPDDTAAGTRSVYLRVSGEVSQVGSYYPLSDAAGVYRRLLDTRTGAGGIRRPLNSGEAWRFNVGGRLGIPYGSVAVVLNVTVTGPTRAGFVSVYPAGQARPGTSSLNFTAGMTRANLVTVPLGCCNGAVEVYNNSGSTHVIADVIGYYLYKKMDGPPEEPSGHFQPTQVERLLDTRVDGDRTMLPGGYYIRIPVSYGAAYNPHITALAVNITVVTPRADGHLTAWSVASATLPETSTLNYTKNSVVPNMAIVKTSPCNDCAAGATGLPSIGIYTSRDAHLIVDIVGFFDDMTLGDGLRFDVLAPTRIADSRTGLRLSSPIGPATTATIVPGPDMLAGGTEVLATNVTAVAPTTVTHLTVWPAGLPRPTASNLNVGPGQNLSNAVFADLGPQGIAVYNNAGSTHLVMDVYGRFYQHRDLLRNLRTPQRIAGGSPAMSIRPGPGTPST